MFLRSSTACRDQTSSTSIPPHMLDSNRQRQFHRKQEKYSKTQKVGQISQTNSITALVIAIEKPFWQIQSTNMMKLDSFSILHRLRNNNSTTHFLLLKLL